MRELLVDDLLDSVNKRVRHRVVEALVDVWDSLHIFDLLHRLLLDGHDRHDHGLNKLWDWLHLLHDLLALLLRGKNWHGSNGESLWSRLNWSYLSLQRLLNALLDKLLGLLEELKLGQGLLEELDSEELVDTGSDEEEHDRAHLLHLGLVLSILLLVSTYHWAVSSGSRVLAGLFPEGRSEHSVSHLLHLIELVILFVLVGVGRHPLAFVDLLLAVVVLVVVLVLVSLLSHGSHLLFDLRRQLMSLENLIKVVIHHVHHLVGLHVHVRHHLLDLNW